MCTFSGIISIGGAHIKPAKPLPKEIQTFIDGAKHGVIYFSLGTVLQTSKLPKEKLEAFLGKFMANHFISMLVTSMNFLFRYIQIS